MQYSYPEPWAVSPTLAPDIARHGLESNVGQLRDEGYTIVENAYSPEFCARLRETILRVTQTEGGQYFDIRPGEGVSAYHLLGTDDIFAEALLNPQLQTLAEYLCGGDFLLWELAASVRYSGASISFNVGGIMGGGFAPIAAQALSERGGLFYVGLYLAVAALISMIAMASLKGIRHAS